jgi:hypothetical protein
MKEESNLIIARLALTQYAQFIDKAIRHVYYDNDVDIASDQFEDELYSAVHARLLEMKIPSNERVLIESEIDTCVGELMETHGATLKRSEDSYDDEGGNSRWDVYDDES